MSLEGTSLKKDFFKFIIPAVVAQWVFALYTMVDAMFVAKGVSETALAAVFQGGAALLVLLALPHRAPQTRRPQTRFPSPAQEL